MLCGCAVYATCIVAEVAITYAMHLKDAFQRQIVGYKIVLVWLWAIQPQIFMHISCQDMLEPHLTKKSIKEPIDSTIHVREQIHLLMWIARWPVQGSAS